MRRPETEAGKKPRDHGGEVDIRPSGVEHRPDQPGAEARASVSLIDSKSAEFHAVIMGFQSADAENFPPFLGQPKIIGLHAAIVETQLLGKTDDPRKIAGERLSNPHVCYYSMNDAGSGEFDMGRRL